MGTSDLMSAQTPVIEAIPALIGGEWEEGETCVPVRDPYRGDAVATMPVSTKSDCHRAIAAAHNARTTMAAMPARERAAYLRRVADLIEARTPEIAEAMTRETGKAISDSYAESSRSADTLRLCAEEAVRIEGHHVPMDASAAGAGKIGMTLRFPVGVVAAITPYNAPVNLMMHKLGPSVAAGNATVLKCSPKAPLCVHKALQCFIDAGGLPHGALNAVYGDAAGPIMVSDSRVDFISFTGSTAVGRRIRANAGLKRVTLELGGVGPTIIHRDADLALAATACARHAFLLAGQSCVSVQNIHVHRDVADRFTSLLLDETAKIRFGDPMDPTTEVGTLIDEEAAHRVEVMIDSSVAAGARILAGGGRNGALMQPTVLANVVGSMSVAAQEIFGPAVSLLTYDDIVDVFDTISTSPFGLQAGIFTESLKVAVAAINGLRTGGVIVNATSRWRSDQMPYGGVKESGIGREGPKYAIRDMTDERLFVIA